MDLLLALRRSSCADTLMKGIMPNPTDTGLAGLMPTLLVHIHAVEVATGRDRGIANCCRI